MVSDPVQYLTNFGESITLSEKDAAEKYLVRVRAGSRSTTAAETFDELKVEYYNSASAETVHNSASAPSYKQCYKRAHQMWSISGAQGMPFAYNSQQT